MEEHLSPPIAIIDGVTTIDGPSELLVGNRREFRQKILEAFEAGAREVRVDLAATGYIDASGLGILVSARKTAHAIHADNRIRFTHANADLVTLFEITHLDTLFEISS